jgi:hypothetical protein
MQKLNTFDYLAGVRGDTSLRGLKRILPCLTAAAKIGNVTPRDEKCEKSPTISFLSIITIPTRNLRAIENRYARLAIFD